MMILITTVTMFAASLKSFLVLSDAMILVTNPMSAAQNRMLR